MKTHEQVFSEISCLARELKDAALRILTHDAIEPARPCRPPMPKQIGSIDDLRLVSISQALSERASIAEYDHRVIRDKLITKASELAYRFRMAYEPGTNVPFVLPDGTRIELDYGPGGHKAAVAFSVNLPYKGIGSGRTLYLSANEPRPDDYEYQD